MTHVVMPAGIDTTRDLDLHVPYFSFPTGVSQSNILGNWNWPGCRQCAVVHTGTGDNVGYEANVGSR